MVQDPFGTADGVWVWILQDLARHRGIYLSLGCEKTKFGDEWRGARWVNGSKR